MVFVDDVLEHSVVHRVQGLRECLEQFVDVTWKYHPLLLEALELQSCQSEPTEG
jgi:hypothetical protein